jgi:hypothetical protein
VLARRLELLDTSIVVELLRVPFEHARYDETVETLEHRRERGVRFQLPVAAVVEAGAHVGRINSGHHRRACAERLERMLLSTLSRQLPWTFTSLEWDEELLRELAQPTYDRVQPLREYLASQQLEMGDALIVSEFRRLRDNLDRRAVDVDVWTYDSGLRAVVDYLRS